ncbi:MAG: restriction endonuclease subunit S [Bacteroidales bacterium]|nr:restriction endonuclease subunit S [Bacteroidales bacterium]
MQKLGDYIREVDVRNKDLKVTNLLGLSMSKQFRPSTSNIVGVDLSNYKVVRNNVFAFDPMSVIRVHKVPIALNDTDFPIIVSPAYITFECIDVEKLDPKYLMMWFQRTEFDRYADFKSDAAVRGGYDWKELCETLIIIPSIEQQREIVSEYETISKRIKLNEQIIKNLEATAQTLYHKMFVEGIDKENLPEGWRIGTLGEFCKKMKSGGTPSRNHNEYWNKKDYRWLKSGEIHNNIVVDVEEYISEDGLKNSSAKIIPAGAVIMAMYGATAAQVAYLSCDTTTNQACCNMICHSKEDAAYLFFHLLANQEEIKKLANGGAQENLSQDLIAQQPIILFDNHEVKSLFLPILDNLVVKYKLNKKLINLQSLLLAKMGK